MSISITLHQNNKIYKKNDENKIYFNNLFAPILVSNHHDTLVLTDVMILKALRLLDTHNRINNAFLKAFNVVVKSGSAIRTLKINKKIGGALFSQHPKIEADDLRFYTKEGVRILNKNKLKMYYDFLIKNFSDELRQIILYTTFVHISLNTNRRFVTKRRFIKRSMKKALKG